MTIERFVYGMFDGKIVLYKSDRVTQILTDQNFQYLREEIKKKGLLANDKYYWLKTEQLIALPWVTQVNDDDGREFIQCRMLLVPIHDYFALTDVNASLAKFFNVDWDRENLESIEVGLNE